MSLNNQDGMGFYEEWQPLNNKIENSPLTELIPQITHLVEVDLVGSTQASKILSKPEWIRWTYLILNIVWSEVKMLKAQGKDLYLLTTGGDGFVVGGSEDAIRELSLKCKDKITNYNLPLRFVTAPVADARLGSNTYQGVRQNQLHSSLLEKEMKLAKKVNKQGAYISYNELINLPVNADGIQINQSTRPVITINLDWRIKSGMQFEAILQRTQNFLDALFKKLDITNFTGIKFSSSHEKLVLFIDTQVLNSVDDLTIKLISSLIESLNPEAGRTGTASLSFDYPYILSYQDALEANSEFECPDDIVGTVMHDQSKINHGSTGTLALVLWLGENIPTNGVVWKALGNPGTPLYAFEDFQNNDLSAWEAFLQDLPEFTATNHEKRAAYLEFLVFGSTHAAQRDLKLTKYVPSAADVLEDPIIHTIISEQNNTKRQEYLEFLNVIKQIGPLNPFTRGWFTNLLGIQVSEIIGQMLATELIIKYESNGQELYFLTPKAYSIISGNEYLSENQKQTVLVFKSTTEYAEWKNSCTVNDLLLAVKLNPRVHKSTNSTPSVKSDLAYEYIIKSIEQGLRVDYTQINLALFNLEDWEAVLDKVLQTIKYQENFTNLQILLLAKCIQELESNELKAESSELEEKIFTANTLITAALSKLLTANQLNDKLFYYILSKISKCPAQIFNQVFTDEVNLLIKNLDPKYSIIKMMYNSQKPASKDKEISANNNVKALNKTLNYIQQNPEWVPNKYVVKHLLHIINNLNIKDPKENFLQITNYYKKFEQVIDYYPELKVRFLGNNIPAFFYTLYKEPNLEFLTFLFNNLILPYGEVDDEAGLLNALNSFLTVAYLYNNNVNNQVIIPYTTYKQIVQSQDIPNPFSNISDYRIRAAFIHTLIMLGTTYLKQDLTSVVETLNKLLNIFANHLTELVIAIRQVQDGNESQILKGITSNELQLLKPSITDWCVELKQNTGLDIIQSPLLKQIVLEIMANPEDFNFDKLQQVVFKQE